MCQRCVSIGAGEPAKVVIKSMVFVQNDHGVLDCVPPWHGTIIKPQRRFADSEAATIWLVPALD